ncbi:hypothetical protein COU19_00510 [Candidatus Kaiserbacteria bacterium CG10_big_fil_rev_8_21_14_0_10_56_12]|uniref:Glycosyltransferase subfamily 4-like N-terminal domain-containing protein n=1 Tax=Candidatus Kaiserbacteria bacterium CG10_big_fil_rev_8_21_14_0_10_56_12 TaxID=1974611 RepID=A0A2H0UAJ4_9BACT|nr:MAG: hypothetical protein COU19_00510 [Candidatus Kaiserbacteria bacterium CG10_big_fil_rev_8_21_14_0_10_56_12]
MNLYVVVNARIPSEKAYGIHIAQVCNALAARGMRVTLVTSSRGEGSMREAYHLAHDIPMVRLPVVDLQRLGPLGYRLTAVQFMIEAYLYLLAKVIRREAFVVYTVDMDQFSFVPLVWLPRMVVAEMHSPKRSGVWRQHFFSRAHIVATNPLIADALAQTFGLRPSDILIEPNGVLFDPEVPPLTKEAARKELKLPLNAPFALYVGRAYPWKGLELLAGAAPRLALPLQVVGATREDYERATGVSGEGLHFVGSRPTYEMPLWMAAADVLLVLGTAQNEDSYRYTAPIKLFEYLAAARPVVASRTPALASILTETAVYWYTPDDLDSFIQAVQQAQTDTKADARANAAHTLAKRHTWVARAERIMKFINGPSLHV